MKTIFLERRFPRKRQKASGQRCETVEIHHEEKQERGERDA